MAMYAEVIVDLKTAAVDRCFDYQVPPHLKSTIEVGMRVTVPFHHTTRMGFVILLKSMSQVKELKSIVSLLDFLPTLTPELLELAHYMSKTIHALYIDCFEAMVPAALKANYDKQLVLLDHSKCPPSLLSYFDKASIPIETIANDDLPTLKQAIVQGFIKQTQTIQSKAKPKTVKMVSLNQTNQTINKNQQIIVDAFLNKNTPIKLSELNAKFSSSRVRTLIEKKVLSLQNVETYRLVANPFIEHDQLLTLTKEQTHAIETITKTQKYASFLLHGITGSGKTEVYIRLIDHAISQGKQALLLVPEIGLIPQAAARLKNRFGSRIAILSSALSSGERYDEWRRVLRNEADIVLGTRSAVFAPCKNIGIIIIDEEHDPSYFQDNNPRYDAKALARVRAKYHDIPLVLGSATPSVETYYQAKKNNIRYLELTVRPLGAQLPIIEIVDMKEELKNQNKTIFSKTLFQAIEQRLERGEQIILLLNRRGHANFLLCRHCGHVPMCPDCDVSLTAHKYGLHCHHCGYHHPTPLTCPSCQSKAFRHVGIGTQYVEEQVHIHFKTAITIRMDSDTTKTKGAHACLLNNFSQGKADILIGTQMVSKGLDVGNVTLVGVLMADLTLKIPDIRASERTFQMISQVAGRAGRKNQPGKVIVQAYDTDNIALKAAQKHDYIQFFNHEINVRRWLHAPPFYQWVQCLAISPNKKDAYQLCDRLNIIIRQSPENVTVLGPTPALIGRIKNQFRIQMILRFEPNLDVDPLLSKLFDIAQNQTNAQLIIDKNASF